MGQKIDNLLIEIGRPTTISHLYQENLSASKVIMKQTKTNPVIEIFAEEST